MQDIRDAVSWDDEPTLERAAHTFKGAVSYLCARDTDAATSRLEEIGRNRDLATAAKALERLEESVQELNPAVAETVTQIV
jgi:hypothetical protein